MKKSSKYLNVYNLIKADILSEVYMTGSFLPTEKELMSRYQASRTTIRHAIDLLRKEQVVSVKQGKGTQLILKDKSRQDNFLFFHNVTGITNSFPLFEHDEVHTQGCIISVTNPPPDVMQAMNLNESSSVYRLERLYFINKTPFAWQISYLTCDYLSGFEKFSGQIDSLHNLYSFLDSQYHARFVDGTETISAMPAGFFDAKLLETDAGAPLLVFVRNAIFTDGTKEYTRILTRPDLVQLTVSMSGPPDGNPI